MLSKTKPSSKNIKKLAQLGGPNLNEGLFKMQIGSLASNNYETELLVAYFYLITKTDFLDDRVYQVLVKGRSYSDVTSEYDITYTTLKNLVYNESKKVFKLLTQDPYALVVDHSETVSNLEQLTILIKQVTKDCSLLDKVEIKDHLHYDFSDYATDIDFNILSSVDDDEYAQLLEKLRPLSKQYLERIFNFVDTNLLAYISYLIRTPDSNLSKSSLKHKKKLKASWWIPDE